MNVRRSLAIVTGVTCLAVALHAHASDEDDARAAMRRGAAALQRGDAEAALSEYDAAKRLAPRANAPWFFAAEALAQLGRWRDVVVNLEVYLAKDPTVSDADEVRSRIARVREEHFPARLRVISQGADVTIHVDGEAKGPPGTFELSPGAHHVEARAPAAEPTSRDVDLVGDRESTVELTPRRAVAGVSPGTADATSGAMRTSSMPWRTVGFAAAGVGVAGLVTTFVIDAAVLGSKVDEYRLASARGDETARELRGDVHDLQTAALVGYAVSGAILMAGAALALFAPRSSNASIPPRFSSKLVGFVGTYAF